MARDPSDARPPFRRIADALRAAIQAGEYPPGSRLPSERELVDRYGTAHATVRQAVALLKTEGLVVTEQGKGAFVRPAPMRLRLAANHYFLTQARQQGRAAESRLLDVETLPAPPDVAKHLSIPPDGLVVVRRYLLLLDDVPAQYDQSYWPAVLVGATAIAQPEKISPGRIDSILKHDLGRVPHHFHDELAPRMPTPDESRILRLLPSTPIVDLTRVYYDAGGAPLEVGRVIIAGDRHLLIYEVEVKDGSSG